MSCDDTRNEGLPKFFYGWTVLMQLPKLSAHISCCMYVMVWSAGLAEPFFCTQSKLDSDALVQGLSRIGEACESVILEVRGVATRGGKGRFLSPARTRSIAFCNAGGSTFSSWSDIIWPSFRAAPRIRHSAFASRSALASDITALADPSEGGLIV